MENTLGGCVEQPKLAASRPAVIIDKYWWHVNKEGFPISDETWSKMWDYVVATHPEGEMIAASIRGKLIKKTPILYPPVVNIVYAIENNLLAVQRYMEELQYNHTGTQFFDIKKTRPLSR